MEDLEAQLESLRLMCAAMGSFLTERSGITEEEFRARVREIDLRDGKTDGRMVHEAAHCPQCKRVMSARHGRCLYCGARELQIGPVVPGA